MISKALLCSVVATMAVALTGCVTNAGFNCETDSQCGSGFCESTGFCSFADPECDSGRRYGSEAGGLSGVCTDLSSDEVDAAVTPTIDGMAGTPDGTGGIADAGPPDAMDVFEDFAPSNFGAELLTAATNGLTLQANDGVVRIDTDTGSIRRMSDMADLKPIGVEFTTVAQGAGEPAIGVFSMTEISVEQGVTIEVVGNAALAFAVSGNVVLDGEIIATGGRADTHIAGPGGFAGGTSSAAAGRGPGAGEANEAGGDVGGGGAGHAAAGGAGGGRASSPGGDGGGMAGGAPLSPLMGGSGGASGGGGITRGAGGGGGGAVQIAARGKIVVGGSAVINVGGGGGGGGGNDDGGGGGGAGGGVLLESARIIINGVVAANGGGGGAGADQANDGAAGETGLASAVRASGGAAAGEGAAGGAGGAGEQAAGAPGGATPGTAASDNAGGGGGGAGRIRLRSDDIMVNGTVSPTAGTTQATL